MSSSFPCLSLPFSSPPLSSVLLFSQHDFSPLHSMIVEVKTKRQIRQKNYGNYLSPEIFSPQRDLFGCGGTFPTQKKYPHSQKRPYGGEKFRLERKSLWRKARIFRLNLTWTMRHWENWDCWNFDFNVQLFIYLSQILIKCICCTVQIRNTSSSLSHTHSHMDIDIDRLDWYLDESQYFSISGSLASSSLHPLSHLSLSLLCLFFSSSMSMRVRKRVFPSLREQLANEFEVPSFQFGDLRFPSSDQISLTHTHTHTVDPVTYTVTGSRIVIPHSCL